MGLGEARGGGSRGPTVDPQTKAACLDGGGREAGRGEKLGGQAPSPAYLGQKDGPAPPQTPPLPPPASYSSGGSPGPPSSPLPPPPPEQKPPSGLVYRSKVNKSVHFGLLPWAVQRCSGWRHL